MAWPINDPRNYRGTSGDRTRYIQKEATPPAGQIKCCNIYSPFCVFGSLKSAEFEKCGTKLTDRLKWKPFIQMANQYLVKEISRCESVENCGAHRRLKKFGWGSISIRNIEEIRMAVIYYYGAMYSHIFVCVVVLDSVIFLAKFSNFEYSRRDVLNNSNISIVMTKHFIVQQAKCEVDISNNLTTVRNCNKTHYFLSRVQKYFQEGVNTILLMCA